MSVSRAINYVYHDFDLDQLAESIRRLLTELKIDQSKVYYWAFYEIDSTTSENKQVSLNEIGTFCQLGKSPGTIQIHINKGISNYTFIRIQGWQDYDAGIQIGVSAPNAQLTSKIFSFLEESLRLEKQVNGSGESVNSTGSNLQQGIIRSWLIKIWKALWSDNIHRLLTKIRNYDFIFRNIWWIVFIILGSSGSGYYFICSPANNRDEPSQSQHTSQNSSVAEVEKIIWQASPYIHNENYHYSEYDHHENSFRIQVDRSDQEMFWYIIILSENKINLEPNKQYVMEFDAKSSKDFELYTRLGEQNPLDGSSFADKSWDITGDNQFHAYDHTFWAKPINNFLQIQLGYAPRVYDKFIMTIIKQQHDNPKNLPNDYSIHNIAMQ